MKRKTLIVLLVLLLVGILAFTVFACNDKKPPNNPGTDTPGGDGPGPDDENPPEEETYAIVEALPKLVTGLDKVAATVADIDAGKGAYLGADIGLNFGVTADGLDVAADLVLSLKVSVDAAKSANNWALIGLKSDKKDVAQLYIHAEAANKEVIYIKEAFTGSNNWKVLSVLDTTAKPDELEGLFTGSNYGLIGKLFSLVTGLTAEDSTFPIDFDAASPIGGLEIMEGSTINSIVSLVGLLGEVVDGALHAEAFDNGNRYVATLNRAGIGDLIGGLMGSFDLGDLLTTLEKLNPVLRLVLGMEVKDGKFDVLKYDDPDDAPVLDIEFSVDPETAALTDLSIDFANGDIEGMGITLGLALSNIVLSDESKAPDTETAGAEALGINLELQAKLPAWKEAATIAVSVDPKAVIGWNAKDGSIEIDLSAVQGHATFKDALIAEYTTNGDQKGFAITLKPVYEFIAPLETGVRATDLRDQVYFIPCDLNAIVTAALNPTNGAGTQTIQNAALADQIDLSGTLGTLVETIQAMIAAPTFDIASIGNIIGPALTDSNSIVKLLLAEITKGDSIKFDPKLGEDITTSASVTVNAPALVEFVMGDNLLGGEGFDKLLNIQLYDFSEARAITDESAADAVTAANTKNPLKLGEILKGDIIEVVVDLIYTAMYEGADANTRGTFVEFAKKQVVDEQFILDVAAEWEIDEITNDGKLNVSEIGNITASIRLGDGIHVTLEALGAYVSLGGDLDAYVAHQDKITGEFKVITSWDEFNAAGGLQNALMQLASYALGKNITAAA